MFFDEEQISCNFCGEFFNRNARRCPNCRLTINQRNQRNNYYANSFHQIDFNILTEMNSNINNKNNINDLPVKEVLETKKMNSQLYIKKKGRFEPPICCICLENIVIGQNIYQLSCKHLFHKSCVTNWFKEKSECPYCRKKYNVVYK